MGGLRLRLVGGSVSIAMKRVIIDKPVAPQDYFK
jgi:hypothetical protein